MATIGAGKESVMTKCPRCHSTMLLDYSDSVEGYQRMWRCIGCGREILTDPQVRAAENRLFEQIQASTAEGRR